MKNDDFYYLQTGAAYQKVISREGVRITICENRFEVVCQPKTEVWEQQVVQMLREWIKSRKVDEV